MVRLVILLLAICSLGVAKAESGVAALPTEVVINGVEFVHIPGGWTWHPIPHMDPKTAYNRGSGMREIKVWTDPYYLAKYEARAGDFERFMNSGASRYTDHYDNPNLVYGGAGFGCSVRKDVEASKYYLVAPDQDLPATHLSWDLANEFATWMGFRLPTDAEWGRAFRGDDRRTYPWGREYPDDTFAGFEEGRTECDVRPVGAFPKGQSPYGVYDMAGNVYEYVADWFNVEYYNSLKDGVRNPVATQSLALPGYDKEPTKVLRGGRWASGPGELSIYGNRHLQPHDEPFRCYGTRFALDEAAVQRHLAAGSARVLK